MKISPVKQNARINFTSNQRIATNVANKGLKNTTSFFRGDLDWDYFTNLVIEKYKHKPKVNVYCYACSDGSEPYSLAMMLISKLGRDKAQKFFPIKAKDIDPFFIEQAQKGVLKPEMDDLRIIRIKTLRPLSTFMDVDGIFKQEHGSNVCTGKITDNLKGSVEFMQANIVDDIDNIEPKNSIIMFRNAWPHLNEQDKSILLNKLSKKMDDTSLLTIGWYDRDAAGIDSQTLQKYGLFETDVNCCFTKANQQKNFDSSKNQRSWINLYLGRK